MTSPEWRKEFERLLKEYGVHRYVEGIAAMSNATDTVQVRAFGALEARAALLEHLDATPAAQPIEHAPSNWLADSFAKFLRNKGYSEADIAKEVAENKLCAAPQAAQPDDMTAIYDAFNIGADVRTPDILLTSVQNAARRASCLSAIENEFFTKETPPDDGEDEPGEECPLNWGAEPAEYVEQFRAELAQVAAQPALDKKQMDVMVNRFLGWKLPQTFGPDCYISFDRVKAQANSGWPIGTNLLSADEARLMLEHILGEAAPLPEQKPAQPAMDALPSLDEREAPACSSQSAESERQATLSSIGEPQDTQVHPTAPVPTSGAKTATPLGKWQKRNRFYIGPWLDCTEKNAKMLIGTRTWDVRVVLHNDLLSGAQDGSESAVSAPSDRD